MARIAVEVVDARPGGEECVRVSVAPGATVRDVLEKSGLLPLARGRVGVFGKVVPPDTPVRDGDRVEIYRPLHADPKEARRLRAKKRARGSSA